MINISNLSKNFGPRTLFSNVSLNINRGEKIGLVGPNGAGKSTLFSLILEAKESPDCNIQINKNIRIGYLPQESSFASEHTVISEIVEGESTIMKLTKEKSDLETNNQAGSLRYGEILHQLDTLGYFELEHKAKKILMGLGFKEKDFDRLISQMSGGWQMRVLLAKLLVHHYDILLLDEPTNYLDLNAALWFKDFLKDFNGTFVMISHDKAFLTEVTNYTLILENGVFTKVSGNYDHYEQIKEEKRTHLIRQFKEQEKKREQLEEFVARFHAQPNKAASVRSKRKVLESMEEIIIPARHRDSIRNFRFPVTKRSGHMVIKLEDISKAYGDIQVYKDFNFEITQGEKAVLAGDNGAGKSTLLKILADVVKIDSGVRKPGHNISIGYFSQTRLDVLHPENTVLKEAYSACPGYMGEETVRTVLGAFLFSGEDADKKVGVLSGGEKSRLVLAKLLLNPPNFLLLDEPTTHLDVDAVEALVKALKEYEGTVVFISHDIYFVRSVANMVYEVKGGNVRKYHGNFDYYLDKKAQNETESREIKPKIEKDPKIDLEKEKKLKEEKLRKEEEAKRKNHNKSLGAKITILNNETEKLNLEKYAKARLMSNPNTYRNEETLKEYGRRLKEIEKRLVEIETEICDLRAQML